MSDKEQSAEFWKKEALALVVLLRAKCSDEEWANMESRFECTAPAPQTAEGCEHFWRTVPVSPRWSWFTECEKCKVGAPLELQAENYVEGTSEQASPTPEKCPTCGSTSKNVYYAESNDASKRCDPIVGRSDPWHSSAPKSRDTGISLDGGKTIHSKFKND